jgi:hypothetical protein
LTGASESWKEANLSSFFATNAAVGINAANSYLNSLGVIVPPATAVLNGFVWIADTEQKAIGTNLVDDILQGGSGQVSAGSDLDVLLEVVIDSFLSHKTTLLVSNWPHHILNQWLMHRKSKDMCSPVTDDDLQLPEAAEPSILDRSQGVQADTVGEGQWGSNHVLALGLQLVQDDIRRSSGMAVQLDVELGEDVPELVVGGLVVVEVGLAIGTGVLKVATESTVGSELLNTATQLLVSLLSVVHGQMANGPMPSRLFLDLVRRPVVGLLASVGVFPARALSERIPRTGRNTMV